MAVDPDLREPAVRSALEGDRMPISKIKVGQRYRKDLGDLTGLKESMAKIGLLQAVVITPDHTLIAGARRLAAAKQLGWKDIHVHVVNSYQDASQMLIAERDENTQRMDMKPSEATRLGMAIEAMNAEARRKHQMENLQRNRNMAKHRGGNLPPPSRKLGKARDAAANAVGYSENIYGHIKAVVTVVDDENTPAPLKEAAQDALDEMDRTRKISGAYDRFKRIQDPTRPVRKQEPVHPKGKKGEYTARQKLVATGIRDTTLQMLHTLDTISREISNLRLHHIGIVADDEEIQKMEKMYDRATLALRKYVPEFNEKITTQMGDD